MRIRSEWRSVWNGRAVLGESPTFDPRDRQVWWLDIKSNRLMAYDAATETTSAYTLPCRVCSIVVPDKHWDFGPPTVDEKTFLSAGDRGFAVLTIVRDIVTVSPLHHPEAEVAGNRFNDGKLGPDGRYFAGTMDDAEQEARGSLYAFAPDRSCRVIDTGYLVPNGPAFSKCGRYMYHTDSARRHIYRFAVGSKGDFGSRETWHVLDPRHGYPDGMAVDTKGNVLVGLWDGSAIGVLSPDGQMIGTMELPTSRITSVALDPLRPGHLFSTSAAIGVHDDDTYAGNLFEVVYDLDDLEQLQ